MYTQCILSRREFFKMAGITASAAMLGACAPQRRIESTPTPLPTVAPPPPTFTQVAPTATATLKPTRAPTRETKPIPPEMVLVEPGSFQMGSADGPSDERPVHTVRITRPFHIAKYEVTFEEYERFLNDTVGHKKPKEEWGRGKQPVMGVDWNDALAYCNWLSEKEGLAPCYTGKGILTRCDFAANGYRLPTEAEWEYAARGGNKSKGYQYAGSDKAGDVAWYADNSSGKTQTVGQKQPNELGLFDMSGNSFEWCWDLYDDQYYAVSPSSDPTGPSKAPAGEAPDPRGANRVRRSGNWRERSDFSRVTCRSFDYTGYPGENGFRLVRTKST